MNCIFCKIVDGSAPAHIVEENRDCMAIVPLDVEVDGHLLVLPKQHYGGIEDIPSDLLGKLLQFIQEVCLDLKLHRKFDGFNILNASGSAAQQSVPHFHIHILPRNENDGINAWPLLPGGRNIYAKTHGKPRSEKVKQGTAR